jgi:hypothetical protein
MRELSKLDIVDAPTAVKREVVEELRSVLEMAERGEIQEMVLIALKDDGHVLRCWTTTLDHVRRVGMIETVKHEALKDWSDDR